VALICLETQLCIVGRTRLWII